MIVIIGGAYQGKLDFAVSKYNLSGDELCDLKKGFVPGKKCYYHFEEYTKSNDALPDFPKDCIVISREIGSGVVPIDKGDRAWRKTHGLLLQELVSDSREVYQLLCAIPRKLK